MELDLKKYLLNKPEAVEDFPFDPGVAVYKVRDKMFALIGKDNNETRINLKCDPAEAEQLRMTFDAVLLGYHMNKKHWNTVAINDSIPNSEAKRMIGNSYVLVVKTLSKSAAHFLLQ